MLMSPTASSLVVCLQFHGRWLAISSYSLQARLPGGGATAPDFLLLRSKLNHFIHNTFGTICINAGSLAKGSAGGTYARIEVFPERETDAAKPAAEKEIVDRASIQIVRI